MAEQNESLWNNLKKGLQDSAAMAVTKAEELTLLGRARLDIAAAKTRLSRLHAELGAAVYESSLDGAFTKTPEVQQLCDQIGRAVEAVSEAEAAFERVSVEQEDAGRSE